MRLNRWFTLALVSGGLLASPSATNAGNATAESVWEELSKVERLEARFVLQRHTDLFSMPLESSGVLRFERPDRLSWEMETPARSRFVMNGSQVGLWFPDLGVREEIDVGGQPEIMGLIQGMMIWLTGDLEQVQRDYALEWAPGPPMTIHLTPNSPELSQILAAIDLVIDGDPILVRGVTLHEPDGDRVEIALHDFQVDATLPDDAFLLPAPERH